MLVENKKAAATLFEMFWSSAGWKQPPELPAPEERLHAVEAGYLFDTLEEVDHDDLIRRTKSLGDELSMDDAAACFAESLATRRLHLRPFLPSLVVAKSMPSHEFDGRRHPNVCAICGAARRVRIDRNVLNFERHKWGGVRHTQPDFLWFCLDRLETEGPTGWSTAGEERLKELLGGLRQLPAGTSLTNATGAAATIKGSRDERLVVLEQLATIDILTVPDHPGFLSSFTDHADRTLPATRFADRGYPGAWWTADMGTSDDAINELFPRLNT